MSRSLLQRGTLSVAPSSTPGPARIPICTRMSSYTNGFSAAAGAALTITFRRSHRITADCTDLVLHFGNWANNNGTYAAGANTITVTASVVMPDGSTLMPAYFKGARAVTIDGGGVVATDPLPAELKTGQIVQTLTAVTVATGGKYPLGIAGDGTSTDAALTAVSFPEGDNSVAATGDVTVTPGNTTASNNVSGYSPQAITGLTKPGAAIPRTWVIAGDSWTVGGGDSAHDWGWVVRWLAPTYGYFHTGAGNSGAVYLLGTSGRAPLVPIEAGRATDVVLAHGTNDRLGNAGTLAAFQANLIGEATRFARRGMRVWVPTIGPRTTSTDLWETAGNQTPVANETNRVTWNTWIRARLPIDPVTLAPVAVGTGGALLAGQAGHPVSGYLEVADILESARDSGLWKGADRTVTDAAITSGQTTLTSATANFTAADVGKNVIVIGAGSAGGNMATSYITSVTNATTVVLSGGASTTVTGATVYIGIKTTDGVHPSRGGHLSVVAGLPSPASLTA